MEWYKNLDINQKINLKDCTLLLCGVEWEALSLLFNFRERVEIVYNKLKIEGFDLTPNG